MSIFRNKKVIIPLGVVLLIVLVIIFTGGEEDVTYETVVAESMDLVQEINATGRVEAVDRIDLAFERSGRVERVYAQTGDMVERGDPVVALESSELYAELSQAKASVDSARATLQQFEAALLNQQARLAELKMGARPEEIQFYQSKVASAEASLRAAHETMIDSMRDAYTRSEDAVRSKSDPLFNGPSTPSPTLKFTTSDFKLQSDLNAMKVSLDIMLDAWQMELLELTSDSDLNSIITTSKANLDSVKLFLEKMSVALNGALTTPTVTQTTIDAWIIDVSAARTSINVGITNHTAAKEKLNSAESNLVTSKNELALKESGGTPEQIDAQEALVGQAIANIASQEAQVKLQEAAVQSVEARLAKNILRAPFAGTVTKQDAKKGALVVAGNVITSVISEGVYEIIAQIVEADIVGLEVGDSASLTLDAYGDDVVFTATVSDIDPAADLIEGVANYRTTLVFDESDSRVRAGMTADIDIVTDEKDAVIAIPQRAVIFREGEKVVRILQNETVQEVPVETGITGERGMIEIISGVRSGDVVVTSVNR